MEMGNLKVKTTAISRAVEHCQMSRFFTHPKITSLKGSFSPHKFMILKI